MAAIEVKTKGFDRAIADQEKLNKTAEKHGKALNATAQEAQRSAAILKRVVRDAETDQERYNRRLREAQVALAGHARETELLARVQNKLQRELFETSQEYRDGMRLAREMDETIKKADEAQLKRQTEKSARIRRQQDEDARQSQQIVARNLTADEKLYAAQVRLNDLKRRGALNDRQWARENKRLQDEYQKELGETADKVEGLGAAGSEAFDPQRVVKWGLAVAGPSALLAKTLGTLRDIRQEQEALANKSAGETLGAGALVQLAGGDQAKRDALMAAADATFGEGFIRDRSAAYGLTFELGSANLLNERRFFSQLSAIDDASQLAKSYGLIRQAFSGGDAIGSAQSVVGKAIAGALPAVGVSPSQIAEGVALASAPARAFQLTDEEMFAAVSRVAELTGSGSEAGTAVGSILSSLTQRGYADRLKGQGLAAVIAEIEAMGLDEKGAIDEFGDKNAYKAFSVLRDQAAFGRRVAEIQAAEASNLAQQTVNNALGSERIGAGVSLRAGQAQDELSQDAIAQNRARAEGAAARATADRRRSGSSEINNRITQWAEATQRFFFGDSAAADSDRQASSLRESARGAGLGSSAETMTPLELIAYALNREAEMSRQLLDATKEQTEAVKKNSPAIPVK